ncbi:BLUF domain-containing protein [Diaphorobacter sp. HDW4A]|uniref:BLUF domain-containing protein n=1 Tax=Diaphorobacter sp. HDW4A TaxID=2714924 RepID=UPI00140CD2F4|nr:BLUF domain-containing protein [Diaphorobacter sp. HDW4A]QIL81254.1 BLUF domain-containing protein [Diaphorobacter sp. HDW4A]
MQVVCYFGKAARQGKVALPTDSLLAASEEFARRNELTGLLAISDGYFLHVLEGEDTAVQNLVGRIAAFWDQESPTILFERSITQRNFQQWNVVISHGSKHRADAAQRLSETKRFLDDDPGDAADPFRYFLTPNRSNKPVVPSQPVRQVAIFSNSVLWFNPIFSHLSERFGTQACALKVSNTGKDADSYPLDYADVVGDSAGPVRIVGISEGLLASTLSQPLLEKIELMVFLMRRSGQGTDTEFVARALAHPVVQRCKPRVLFVTPGGNTSLSDMLHQMVHEAGLQSTETRGSVLMGGPTWKAIHEQLLSMVRPLRQGAKAEQDPPPITEVDLMLDPEPAEPQPPTVIAALTPEPLLEPEPAPERPPPQAAKAGKKSTKIAAIAAIPERSVDLSGPALKDMLERLMYGIGTTAWAGWLDMRVHDFAARTDNAPEAATLKLVAETVTNDLDLLTKRGQMREMISTFSEHHEIMVPHPLDSTLVLYLFARLDDLPLATLRRLILDDLMD